MLFTPDVAVRRVANELSPFLRTVVTDTANACGLAYQALIDDAKGVREVKDDLFHLLTRPSMDANLEALDKLLYSAGERLPLPTAQKCDECVRIIRKHYTSMVALLHGSSTPIKKKADDLFILTILPML